MEPIHIKCPCCSEEASLSLDVPAEMVLLNCQKCNASLLYIHGETLEVDEVQMEKFSNKSFKSVDGYLNTPPAQITQGNRNPKIIKASHSVGQELLDHVVTKNEITDLIIDIETASCVQEFIDKM